MNTRQRGNIVFKIPHRFVCCNRLAAAVIIVAIFAAASRAEEPTPQAVAVAKELVILKGSTQVWSAIVPGVIEQAKGVFLQTNPMLSKELNDVAAQLRAEYTPRSSQIIDQIAQLYAASFTQQELNDALAFYKSPLGQKIIQEEPKILDNGIRRVQQWTNKFSEEVINRMRTEMKKKGHDL